MHQIINYFQRPFAKSSALFAGFIFSYIFLVRLLPGKIVTLMAFGGVALMFFEALRRNLIPVFVSKVLPLLPWVFFVLLSILVLPLIPYAGSRAWNNLTGVTLAICVFGIVRVYGRILFMEPLFMSYVFLVLVFFVLFPGILGVGGGAGNGSRLRLGAASLGGGGMNPNDVARLLGVSGLMIVSGFRINLRQLSAGPKSLLLLNLLRGAGILAAIFIIVFHTGSRSGLVWVVAILAFPIAAYYNKNIILGVVLCGTGAIFVLGLAFFVFPDLPVFSRITVLFDEVANRSGGEASAVSRGEMILDGLALWQQSPIWGNGNEAFRVLSDYGTYSHCNYTELLANYGFLGFAAFYIPFFIAAIHAWNLRKSANEEVRRQALWLLICCSLPFVISFVNVIYYSRYMLLFYGVVLGKVYFLKDNFHRMNQMGMRRMPHRRYRRYR